MKEDEIQRRVAANIKKFRKEKGISQQELGKLAGLSDQTINSIEICRKWPSQTTLSKITNVLEVDIYQLFLPTVDTYIYEKEANELKRFLYDKIKKIIEDGYNQLDK